MTLSISAIVPMVCLLIACSPNLAGAAESQPVRRTSTMPARAMAAETINHTPIPQEASTLHGKLYPKLQPSVRAWVGEQARKLSAGTMTVESLHSAGQNRFGRMGQAGGGDIEAVAFLVLMQAARDMDGDLKMIMAEVKRQQEAKNKLRDLISRVNKDVESNTRRKSGDPCTPPQCGAYARELSAASSALGRLYPNRDIRFQEPKTVNDLKPLQGALVRNLDGMNGMSEMTSIRLQAMMDRRSKIITTLSNIMKKISTTRETIVQNLK